MRTYTQEEKQAVIDRVISDEPLAHILADTGIPKSAFYSWLRNYRFKTMNDYMRSLHITHSFSRAHVPYYNSVMESFFSSMKRDKLYRTKYRSESDFRSAVEKYIIFYNANRPHKKLQYKTPQQKEEYTLKDASL